MSVTLPAEKRLSDINLADAVDDLGRLVLAAWMAAEALGDASHQGAIQTVLDIAETKIRGIKAEVNLRLTEARGEA